MTQENNPVFVKIKDYNQILDELNKVKKNIKNAKDLIAKIRDLRAEEDAEIDLWDSDLDDVEQKIINIDKTMFES